MTFVLQNGFEIEDAENARKIMSQSWQSSEMSGLAQATIGEGDVKASVLSCNSSTAWFMRGLL